MKNIDKIIEQSNEKINQAELKTFTPILSARESGIIIYKYDKPLHDGDIQIKKSQNYSLFDMYSLSSLSIIFAYVFVFENKTYNVYDKYFYFKRPSVKNVESFSGVDLIYQSAYINIFLSEEGAVLISANKLFNVVEQDMVRRSKGTNK